MRQISGDINLLNHLEIFVISDYCRGVIKFFFLQGCYAGLIDSLGQPIGPTFKGQAVQEEMGCLPLEDEIYRLFETSVTNCHLTMYNIPEERKSHRQIFMFFICEMLAITDFYAKYLFLGLSILLEPIFKS
jgi:hypothetical protein